MNNVNSDYELTTLFIIASFYVHPPSASGSGVVHGENPVDDSKVFAQSIEYTPVLILIYYKMNQLYDLYRWGDL